MGDGSTLAAVGIAFAAACGFAVGTSLQHHQASGAPNRARGFAGLVRYLITRPLWLLGNVAGVVAVILHAAALRFGSIEQVQPIMVSGVVLAVVARDALARRRPSGAEIGSVVLTALGVAAFVVVGQPTGGGTGFDNNQAGLFILAGLVTAALLVWIATKAGRANRQALVFGAASGVCSGLSGGLLKIIASGAAPDLFQTIWPIAALLVTGPCGVIINQRAYRVAPISMSMLILNVVNVLVAISFGWTVLAHTPSRNVATISIEVLALIAIGIGLRLITKTTTARAAQLG